MPLTLAADTSTPVNSVALCQDDQVLAATQVQCDRLHSERLIDTVDWVLNQARHTLNDVELFTIATGPGSFTGLRIGAATWKGLAFAIRRPLVAVPTLDALARLAPTTDGLVVPVLDAKMKEVFAAVYEFRNGERNKILPDQVSSMDALLDVITDAPYFLGDGVAPYKDAILERFPKARLAPPCLNLPQAVAVAYEGQQLFLQGAETDPGLLAPVYLRKSQAELHHETKTQATP